MQVDPGLVRGRDFYRLLVSCVVPRPIAFVSTTSAAGAPNLAPFSFFNAVSATPPILAVAPGFRRGVPKDTLRNLRETRECVVHVVTEDLADAMNVTSGDYAPDVSEFAVAGLTPVPSLRVKPPRVAEAPVAFECRLVQEVRLGEASCLQLLEIVYAHVRDDLLVDGAVDPARLRAIARLGGDWYCRTRDLFAMARPDVGGPRPGGH